VAEAGFLVAADELQVGLRAELEPLEDRGRMVSIAPRLPSAMARPDQSTSPDIHRRNLRKMPQNKD